MSREVWRDILGYEGMYQISSLGRVRSLARVGAQGNRLPERILSPTPHAGGYRKVTLYLAGARHKGYVHRLVAAAFLGPQPEGMEVCHNDGNPSNNVAANLRWDTHSNNLRDSVLHGRGWAARTECNWGHPFDEGNTARSANGRRRICRTCRRARQARYEAKKAGAAA